MRLKTRTWVIISLLCFVGAVYFWRLGDEKAARDRKNGPQKAGPSNVTTRVSQAAPRAPFSISRVPPSNPGKPESSVISTNRPFPYRLSNSTKGIDELVRSDDAILLRNALIDLSLGTALPIPPHLRAHEDPGSYIVQARGTITEGFRRELQDAGASIVSYVPNNAYLVEVSQAGAQRIGAFAGTQAVLPWEPYYKLSPTLLKLAVENQTPPNSAIFNVLVFPGQSTQAKAVLESLAGEVLGEDRSPFGQQLVVKLPGAAFISVAQMPSVQAM